MPARCAVSAAFDEHDADIQSCTIAIAIWPARLAVRNLVIKFRHFFCWRRFDKKLFHTLIGGGCNHHGQRAITSIVEVLSGQNAGNATGHSMLDRVCSSCARYACLQIGDSALDNDDLQGNMVTQLVFRHPRVAFLLLLNLMPANVEDPGC